MVKLDFKVFDLTLATQRVVKDLNIHGAVCCHLIDPQFLQVLEFTYDREDHGVHHSVYIFVLQLEDKVLHFVAFEQANHLVRVVEVIDRWSRYQRMRQLSDLLAPRQVFDVVD